MNTRLLRKPWSFEGAQRKVGIIAGGSVGLPLALFHEESVCRPTEALCVEQNIVGPKVACGEWL